MKRKIITDITYIKRKSKQIPYETEKDKEFVNSVIKDLEDSLDPKKGIGLTAIQIGIPLRVAIIRIPGKEPINLINPKILDKLEPYKAMESCLSLPGLRVIVRRYRNVLFKNGDGKTYSTDSLEAACVQHELSHMNGRTIIDDKWKRRK